MVTSSLNKQNNDENVWKRKFTKKGFPFIYFSFLSKIQWILNFFFYMYQNTEEKKRDDSCKSGIHDNFKNIKAENIVISIGDVGCSPKKKTDSSKK